MIAQRKFGSFASAVGIAAVSLVTFAGAALADGRGHHGGGFRKLEPAPRFAHGGARFAHGGEHGHRHGNNGAAVALGIGALFLGAVIAAEANRRHVDRDYD